MWCLIGSIAYLECGGFGSNPNILTNLMLVKRAPAEPLVHELLGSKNRSSGSRINDRCNDDSVDFKLRI